jgi:hypothetical protein
MITALPYVLPSSASARSSSVATANWPSKPRVAPEQRPKHQPFHDIRILANDRLTYAISAAATEKDELTGDPQCRGRDAMLDTFVADARPVAELRLRGRRTGNDQPRTRLLDRPMCEPPSYFN